MGLGGDEWGLVHWLIMPGFFADFRVFSMFFAWCYRVFHRRPFREFGEFPVTSFFS